MKRPSWLPIWGGGAACLLLLAWWLNRAGEPTVPEERIIVSETSSRERMQTQEIKRAQPTPATDVTDAILTETKSEKAAWQSEARWQKEYAQKRQIIAKQYALIFERLALEPEIREWLVSKMAELRMVSLDTVMAVKELGLKPLPSDQMSDVIKEGQNLCWAEIQDGLTTEQYSAFRIYNDTLASRWTADSLNQKLTEARPDLRLTEAQVERLIISLHDVLKLALENPGQDTLTTMFGAEGHSLRTQAALKALEGEWDPVVLAELNRIAIAERERQLL